MQLRAALLILGAALLGSLAPPACAADGDAFTIAIIPDTQQEVLQEGDTRLANRFQWLVDHRRELNLKIVLQTGDFLNWDTPDHIQYERASKALEILDRAGLAYGLAIGNHDTAATKVGGSAAPGDTHVNQRNTATFNRYFPVARQKTLRGFYEAGKVDNAWQTFQAGGLNWLAMNLELWPRTGVVEWAKKVADEHPDHNIIVFTHSFLTGGARIQRPPAPGDAPPAAPLTGTALAQARAAAARAADLLPVTPTAISQSNGGYGDNSPQFVFDKFLSQCPNVRLVFSGHVGIYGYHTDRGVGGNTIYEFLTTYHSNIDNPVRLLTIGTRKGTMTTRVFCPSTGRDKDTGSAFTVTGVQWVPAKAQPRVR